MPYNYSTTKTANPLSPEMMYDGLVVCFADVQTNPNLVGVLERINDPTAVWKANMNGKDYTFDRNGGIVSPASEATTTASLYGVLSDGDIDPTQSTSRTRGASAQGEANTVSITTMTPKDHFACEALNALIMRHPNPLSMNDGQIALLAAKAYKIASAMAKEAYGSRQNDKDSSDEQGTAYVEVDETSLQTNTERILYNLNESVKAQTTTLKNTGLKVSNIDKVDFDGTPTVLIGNTTSSPVNTKEVTE